MSSEFFWSVVPFQEKIQQMYVFCLFVFCIVFFVCLSIVRMSVLFGIRYWFQTFCPSVDSSTEIWLWNEVNVDVFYSLLHRTICIEHWYSQKIMSFNHWLLTKEFSQLPNSAAIQWVLFCFFFFFWLSDLKTVNM